MMMLFYNLKSVTDRKVAIITVKVDKYGEGRCCDTMSAAYLLTHNVTRDTAASVCLAVCYCNGQMKLGGTTVACSPLRLKVTNPTAMEHLFKNHPQLAFP